MGRLFFALILTISVHAALLFIKIENPSNSVIASKPEPINITMSYRPKPIKKEIKKHQPETIKSNIKQQIQNKKPSPPPPAKDKSEPVKKKQSQLVKKKSLVKTIKKPDKKIESKLDSELTFKHDQISETQPQEQNKTVKQKQKSEAELRSVAPIIIEQTIEKKIEKQNKSIPREEKPVTSEMPTMAIPKYKINPKLPYPRIAKRRGYQGQVLLLVAVSKTGAAKEVSISKSSGYKLLDNAARKAVIQWQFYPGTSGGKPVEMSVEVPV
ncbi:MAG: energy transducer TonB, partial [Desulfobacula sp.]|nr:energy transducer TonB [Desulfobacula sp.]